VSEVQNVIDNFTADITSLIDEPAQLGTDIISMFQSVTTLFTAPVERFEAMKQFFSFGDTTDPITATTVSLIERKQNQNNIINTYKSIALVEAYRTSAEREYETTDDIDDAQNALENQFSDIAGDVNLEDSGDSGLTEDTLITLQDLRDAVRSFLDNAKLTTAQVVTVRTNVLPAQLLSFIYYGSSENSTQILELNSIRDPSFVSGEVEILSE